MQWLSYCLCQKNRPLPPPLPRSTLAQKWGRSVPCNTREWQPNFRQMHHYHPHLATNQRSRLTASARWGFSDFPYLRVGGVTVRRVDRIRCIHTYVCPDEKALVLSLLACYPGRSIPWSFSFIRRKLCTHTLNFDHDSFFLLLLLFLVCCLLTCTN